MAVLLQQRQAQPIALGKESVMDFTGMDKKVLLAFIDVHESLARASSRDGEILEIIKDLEAEVRDLRARISKLEESK